MKNHTVHVIRDGKFWYITVDGVDGATQARNVGEIETMARDFVSIMEDLPESEVALTIEGMGD